MTTLFARLSRMPFLAVKNVQSGNGVTQSGAELLCVTVVLWTSSHILYGLLLHQKGDISKATC